MQGKNRGRISADAEKSAVHDGEEACVPNEQIQADGQQAEYRKRNKDAHYIGRHGL
jgi:hypothetical protein